MAATETHLVDIVFIIIIIIIVVVVVVVVVVEIGHKTHANTQTEEKIYKTV